MNKADSPGYGLKRYTTSGEIEESTYIHTLVLNTFGPGGCLVSGTNTWTNTESLVTATEGFAGYAMGSHLRFEEEKPGAAVHSIVELDLEPSNDNVLHWGLIGALDPEYVFSELMVLYRQDPEGEQKNTNTH